MKNIMQIEGIECFEKDVVAYLKLETCARGLGFTEVATSGNNLPDFIPENIFYRLAMKAKNEAAEAFQANIADEVIPVIRKTGGYIAGQARQTPALC